MNTTRAQTAAPPSVRPSCVCPLAFDAAGNDNPRIDLCRLIALLVDNRDCMILKQYYLGCLAHASYLLGDEASATGIVVDPQRDIQQYLTDAEKLGLQIRHVFLTHFHADFVAGHLELRDRCGATIHLGS